MCWCAVILTKPIEYDRGLGLMAADCRPLIPCRAGIPLHVANAVNSIQVPIKDWSPVISHVSMIECSRDKVQRKWLKSILHILLQDYIPVPSSQHITITPSRGLLRQKIQYNNVLKSSHILTRIRSVYGTAIQGEKHFSLYRISEQQTTASVTQRVCDVVLSTFGIIASVLLNFGCGSWECLFITRKCWLFACRLAAGHRPLSYRTLSPEVSWSAVLPEPNQLLHEWRGNAYIRSKFFDSEHGC